MSESGWRGPVCRGVRGATTAAANTAEAIHCAARELLAAMIEANGIAQEEVASVTITATPDLTAAYPAAAVRQIGWADVAVLGALEMAPPGSLPCCIRILIHWNTSLSQAEIHHVYINGAEALRPDRASPPVNGADAQTVPETGGQKTTDWKLTAER